MVNQRVFSSRQHFQATSTPAEEPVRSVVTESVDCTVVAWHVLPGQAISSHVHPEGTDVWTVLEGSGDYVLGQVAGEEFPSRRINPGDVAVARPGEVHGVLNRGAVPLRFISVVTPLTAGYQPV
ncbi:cupin domain-containing protein [Polaromonas sp. YR568]|uniref:cupin domain-containing protein n=1 Tax=Polaromonas sp. YR568 TaxID=1855301 RepID=UPI003137A60A